MSETRISDIKNKSKISRSKMGKFAREPRTHTKLWHDAINYYKVAKLTKELIDRIGLQGLAELSGYSTSCISTIERMSVSPQYLFAMQRIKEQLNAKI